MTDIGIADRLARVRLAPQPCEPASSQLDSIRREEDGSHGGGYWSSIMTTQTSHVLLCECGHEGFLDAEEDGGRASGSWIHYSLRGFGGGTLTLINHGISSVDVLEHMSPRCPTCSVAGKVVCRGGGLGHVSDVADVSARRHAETQAL